MIWKKIGQFLGSFFTFQLPYFLNSTDKLSPPENGPTEGVTHSQDLNLPGLFFRSPSETKSSHEKIWVDNVFRFWVSSFSILISLGLWKLGNIENISALLWLAAVYIGLQLLSLLFVFLVGYRRQMDIFLCLQDLIAMSGLIFLTGGAISPFYFLLFIPLIVQAFHRDWALLLFNGLGGVLGYSLAVFFSRSVLEFHFLADLSARILTMLLAVLSALFAVNFLRKEQREEKIYLDRIKMITQISHSLNNLSSFLDLNSVIKNITKILNEGFTTEINGWCRIFVSDESSHTMRALVDSDYRKPGLQEELPIHICPAFNNNAPYVVNHSEGGEGCPAESFSFSSHICVPINGTGNESFGVIFTGSHKSNVFLSGEIQFLQFLGRSIGLTIQRLKRVEELQLSFEMDSCAMAAFVASTKGLDATYRSILSGIKNLLKTEQASLYLWDAENGHLKAVDVIGPYEEIEKKAKFFFGDGIPGQVLENNKPIWTSVPRDDELLKEHQFPYKSMVCLPLQSLKDSPLGVINLWQIHSNRPLTDFETDLGMTFITRATVALENAMIHNKKSLPDKSSSEEEKAA